MQGLQGGCFEQSNPVSALCWEVFSKFADNWGQVTAVGWGVGLQGHRAQLCSCSEPLIKDQDTAKGGWIFFNLHFLNYSQSCQVHTHNRKVTNPAVILKMRSADAVTLILKLFSGGKEEVDWIICSQPCGLKGAGMVPLQGEKQIKLRSNSPLHKRLCSPGCTLQSWPFQDVGSREFLCCSSKNLYWGKE